MGYTHYWYRPKELGPEKFALVVEDFKKLLPYLGEAGVRLADGFGKGEPELGPEKVWFNGKSNCGHLKRELSIPWPSQGAHGVSVATAARPQAQVVGNWFAGALISSRTCNGDCSYETFHFPRILPPPKEWEKPENDKWFDCCKTAFRPYDLAVTAFLVIAQHHLGEALSVSSDGEMEQWQDAVNLCQAVLDYGNEFKLERE